MFNRLLRTSTCWFLLAVVSGCSQSKSEPEADASAAADEIKLAPRAFVPQHEYDFGTMRPDETRKHTFLVRNDGNLALTLTLGETSCKCTLANLKDGALLPGDTAEIDVEWHAEDAAEYLRQGLVVHTNDPKNSRLHFQIEGWVRTPLGVWPPTVLLGDLNRESEQTFEQFALYSQIYDDLKIKSVQASVLEATAEVVEAAADSSRPSKAKYFRTLRIRYRSGAKPQPFGGAVRIVYEVPQEDEFGPRERTLEVPFAGNVVSDVSLHGRQVIGKALVMGTVPQASGKKETVYLHVRNGGGEKVDLQVGSVKPEFLKVQIGELQKLSEKLSRFPVTVEVPPGSPEINLENLELAEVELKTTHPYYPTVRFQVSLAVAR